MSILSTIRSFLSTRQEHLDDHMVLAHLNNEHPFDIETHSHFQTQIDAMESAPPGATGPTGPTGVTGVTGSTGPAQTGVFARPNLYAPTGAIAESISRVGQIGNSAFLSSGRQSFQLMWLEAGALISSITFSSWTTAAGTPTNQWFSIYSLARAKLAVTADDLTTAWASFAPKTLTISGGYIIPASAYYYIGIMVKATTVPTVAGTSNTGTLTGIPPITSGSDNTNTGLTTPASAPNPAAALTIYSGNMYCYVS